MGSADRNLEISNRGLKIPFEYRVLLMNTGEPVPQMLIELEKLPGSNVHVCSTFLELLLCIDHESFHLVVIIEEEDLPLDCQVAIEYLAKAHGRTSVLVSRRTAVEKYLGKGSMLVN